MSRQLFTLDYSQPRAWVRDNRLDWFWILTLSLAALLLCTLNLGGVPLRDWDEGIVAQVAREISQGEGNWLYPTLHGAPYFNKPPLVHGVMAWVYNWLGVNEWTARLPSALFTAFSVPLLYGLGRELTPRRTPALFSALVYLTLLPVVRQGRLAMLEGAVLFLLIFMVWSVLRSRRDLRYTLGSGLAFGLLCLTKGVVLGVLLGGIAFLFLLWDTPRLLKSSYLWLGLLLGSVPVMGWYVAQGLHYGQEFLDANLLNQSLRRVWQPVENNAGAPWYYGLELLKYSWPWLLFWPQGLQFAWMNRNFGWAKLILIWTGVYFTAISLMGTKLPWYILPLYPVFALAVGFYIAEIWQEGNSVTGRWGPGARERSEFFCPQPQALWPVFIVMAAMGLITCFYYSHLLPKLQPINVEVDIKLAIGIFGITMAFTALFLFRKDRQFLTVLVWGSYLSLLLFVNSSHWVWELAEDYPVKPVAMLITKNVPTTAKVYTSHPYSRPSLNFYSNRKVRPANIQELQAAWTKNSQPYFLLDRVTLNELKLQDIEQVGAIEGWILVTRKAGAIQVPPAKTPPFKPTPNPSVRT
ncbi:MAG: ArnT family glycosyltransferase [Microcoleaceae cyanobacterium]